MGNEYRKVAVGAQFWKLVIFVQRSVLFERDSSSNALFTRTANITIPFRKRDYFFDKKLFNY